jgi:hypothetical protein
MGSLIGSIVGILLCGGIGGVGGWALVSALGVGGVAGALVAAIAAMALAVLLWAGGVGVLRTIGWLR